MLSQGYTAYQPRHRTENGFLFPRYSWFRFFMTLLAMIIIAMPLTSVFNSVLGVFSFKVRTLITTPILMGVGFIIVEVIDEFFLEWEQSIDRIRRVVVPIAAVLVLGIIFLVIKYPDKIIRPLSEWRNSVNDKLQSTPIFVQVTPAQGKNWKFLYEKTDFLKTMRIEEAMQFCQLQGPNWQVYDGDKQFIPLPNPSFSRPFSVWMNSLGGQLEVTGIRSPMVFSSSNVSDKRPVLCINKKGGP